MMEQPRAGYTGNSSAELSIQCDPGLEVGVPTADAVAPHLSFFFLEPLLLCLEHRRHLLLTLRPRTFLHAPRLWKPCLISILHQRRQHWYGALQVAPFESV